MIAMGERVSRKMAIFAANLLAPERHSLGETSRQEVCFFLPAPLSLTNVDGKDVWVLRVQVRQGKSARRDTPQPLNDANGFERDDESSFVRSVVGPPYLGRRRD